MKQDRDRLRHSALSARLQDCAAAFAGAAAAAEAEVEINGRAGAARAGAATSAEWRELDAAAATAFAAGSDRASLQIVDMAAPAVAGHRNGGGRNNGSGASAVASVEFTVKPGTHYINGSAVGGSAATGGAANGSAGALGEPAEDLSRQLGDMARGQWDRLVGDQPPPPPETLCGKRTAPPHTTHAQGHGQNAQDLDAALAESLSEYGYDTLDPELQGVREHADSALFGTATHQEQDRALAVFDGNGADSYAQNGASYAPNEAAGGGAGGGGAGGAGAGPGGAGAGGAGAGGAGGLGWAEQGFDTSFVDGMHSPHRAAAGAAVETTEVAASDGGVHVLTMFVDDRGSKGFECSCKGFRFRRQCRHVAEARKAATANA